MKRFFKELAIFMSVGFVHFSCGRGWLPQGAGPCVFDSDCTAGRICFNGRCIEYQPGQGDGGGLAGFGEPCLEHHDCFSGLCLPARAGAFCTRPCAEGCPEGYLCKQAPDLVEGGLAVCALPGGTLCQSCASDLDCDPARADRCLELAGGKFCGADCSFTECPEGYRCQEPPGLPGLRQCINEQNSCDCTESSAGIVRGCRRDNQWGSCPGYQSCLPPQGWGECSARDPRPEDCNGRDDDCDGRLDEELPPGPCSRENQYGLCRGEEICLGADGWWCQAPEPGPESCNGVDNDCDGETDEDFRDVAGRYVSDQHCGQCGADCLRLIAHALEAHCTVMGDLPQCRATACQPGFFPFQDGRQCLRLPANLCRPCEQDQDCVVPGSLCISAGKEKFCGRACDEQSPFGTECPSGYVCLPYGHSRQCQPASGSCLCTQANLGAIRSCQRDTCSGYQFCENTTEGPRWSECNVEDYNPEICDGQDNNCNGQVDEGFRDPATGLYTADAHCGFCNNDCSRYFNEEQQHTRGVCQLQADGQPRCVMGPCSQEEEGGRVYEWVDVDGSSENGCECRRLLGNTSSDPPDLVDFPGPGYQYVDENCDGVDGVESASLFVQAGAPAGGDGSRQRPFSTISQALSATAEKKIILVAEGDYHESVVLRAGVELHGGYSGDFRGRDIWLHRSTIVAVRDDYAVKAAGIVGVPTVLSGFALRGYNYSEAAGPSSPGRPSVALWISGCDGSLLVRSNLIVAGAGQQGGAGAAGQAGFGRRESAALDGGAGHDGQRLIGVCQNETLFGGAGGQNPACPAAAGRRGANTYCPQYDWEVVPSRGAQAEFHNGDLGDGLGGYDWSFDRFSGPSCSHATESGYPSDIQLNVGQDGRDGADGTAGPGGAGGKGSWGSFYSGGWAASDQPAQGGGRGADGQGGGGGGGGGGTARYFRNNGDCRAFEIGPSGGGGGAGGCGGQGGGAGGSGGASLAVLLDGAGRAGPLLLYNLIERGSGGRGGRGGPGGSGGVGGVGGFGGGPPDWISSQGGRGGDGGNGGPGGGGGGGVGGPSFGILAFALDAGAYATLNNFLVPDEVSTAGRGGEGGPSAGANASGANGRDGASANVFSLWPCGAAGDCPAGRRCDSFGVCVPIE